MPEEEVEQRFIVVVKQFGDPEKLRDNTLIALSKALHYSYMPGCLVITGDNRIHQFLPEPEMGRHHTQVVGDLDFDPFWSDPVVSVLAFNPELALKECVASKSGRHCYHHEDDEKVPCCYEQAQPEVENTWQN